MQDMISNDVLRRSPSEITIHAAIAEQFYVYTASTTATAKLPSVASGHHLSWQD